MNKNLIIRADADTRIGLGHLMRCIALAQAWQDLGGDVTFLSNCESEGLRQRIIEQGFNFIPIGKPHPDSYDLDRTLDVLEKLKTWLVLDGYHFTPDYQKAIRENGYKLLAIDDMAHLEYYYADIVLNQNIHAEKLHYSCEPSTRMLLGTRYALLRKEFLAWQDQQREIPETAQKILITLGGGDPDNVTLKIIRAINKLSMKDLEIKVVLGPSNPHRTSLKEAVDHSPFSFYLISSARNMPELMAWADLAVSAGGSTCWELCFMGVPTITIILADNQENIANGLHGINAAINCGWYYNLKEKELAECITELVADRIIRNKLCSHGQLLIDGNGVRRVFESISPTNLSLRKAELDDCEVIFQWANDPATRAVSFNPDPISWEAQVKWFHSKFQATNCELFIAITEHGQKIGLVRFDITNFEATISINIGRDFRGIGWGNRVIRLACETVRKEKDIHCIKAIIKAGNRNSLNAFKKAGFRKEREFQHHGLESILMKYGMR